MAQKKYITLSKLGIFLTSLRENFAPLLHDHDELYYTRTETDDVLSQKTQIQLITWEVDD